MSSILRAEASSQGLPIDVPNSEAQSSSTWPGTLCVRNCQGDPVNCLWEKGHKSWGEGEGQKVRVAGKSPSELLVGFSSMIPSGACREP